MFKNKLIIFVKLHAFVAERNEYNYRHTLSNWHQIIFEGRLCRNAWDAHLSMRGWKWDGIRRYGKHEISNKLIPIPAKRTLSERTGMTYRHFETVINGKRNAYLKLFLYSILFCIQIPYFHFVSSLNCRQQSVQDSHQHHVVIADYIVCCLFISTMSVH